MRVYANLREAISEIERDLVKSPLVESPTIQNLKTPDLKVREALMYSYSVESIPSEPEDILQMALDAKFISPLDAADYVNWLDLETTARSYWNPEEITELSNPHLKEVLEGKEPSYTYTDRLEGMLDMLYMTLARNNQSRRAYFPMFNREDAQRASRLTRVPCTLGYWACIRKVNGQDYLHFTYLQRSCDFRRFWLFDVYLAHMLHGRLYDMMFNQGYPIQMGALSHTILSFHMTQDNEKEVY